MQTLYKFALEPIAETTADPNSYGLRAKRCVQDAIEQCFTCLNTGRGVYDNPDITIRQALDEIVTDLKEPAHKSSLKGSIRTDDERIPIDYDGLIEKAEQAAKEHLEERIRTEAPEAAESKMIVDFKARTEEYLTLSTGRHRKI